MLKFEEIEGLQFEEIENAFNMMNVQVFFFFILQRNAMDTEELGKDMSSVESLLRRHGELVRDSTAIEIKLKVSVTVLVPQTSNCDVIQ